MRICRNKILSKEISIYQHKVNYWTEKRNEADCLREKEKTTWYIWMYRNAIRRINKLKSR